jgi:vitamin B12 transporter
MKKIMRGFLWAAVFYLAVWPGVLCAETVPDYLAPIVVTQKRPGIAGAASLEAQRLKSFPYSSPVEAIKSLPVDLQSRSPHAGIQTDFSLRGAGFQDVGIFMNGRSISDPQTAHHNSDVPLTKEDIEKIEILSGHDFVPAGPAAPGGAIHILPKPPAGRKAVAELEGGQYRTTRQLVSVTDRKGDLGLRASVENAASAGFSEDTDFKKFTSSGSSSLALPCGEMYLTAGYQEKEFGAYDFYTPAGGYPSKEWTKTLLCNLGSDISMDGLRVKPDLIWRRHYDTFMLDKTQKRSLYLSRHRTDVYSPAVYVERDSGFLGKTGVGAAYGLDEMSSSSMGERSRSSLGVYLKESKYIAANTLIELALRRDDCGRLRNMYTAAAGIKNELSSSQSVHFGVSNNIRAPSFTELYYSDPTTRGSEGLSEEKAVACQAGYDYKRGGVNAGLILFSRRESHCIDWVKRSALQQQWLAENISGADVLGLEQHLGFAVHKMLPFSADLYYSYLNKRPRGNGVIYKSGLQSARHLANAALSLPLPCGMQSFVLPYKNNPRRDGWFLADVYLSRGIGGSFTLFVKAANIFNTEYQEIEGVPQPGRWVTSGIRGEW